jgi:hypothetical protein
VALIRAYSNLDVQREAARLHALALILGDGGPDIQ